MGVMTCMSLMAVGAVAFATKGSALKYAANAEVVDFSTKDTTRRVYFVNNDNWWTSDTLYVHAYGGSIAGDIWSGAATKMYDSYNYGLYFADISGVGVGSAITVQIKNDSGSTDDYYTVGVALPALSAKSSDVLWLNSGLTDGHRNASKGTAGGTSGQVASFLNFVVTCSDSYANGYNAYPQLYANFIQPSQGELDAYGNGTYVEDKDAEDHAYTVNQKIAELDKQYTKYGWTVAE